MILSHDELIAKIQNDMEALTGDDLAELARLIGINAKYQGDSLYEVTEAEEANKRKLF